MSAVESDHLIEEMLTPAFVADTLSVTTQTIRTMIQRGDLKGIRINRQWRIPKSSFVAYLNECHGANGATKLAPGGQKLKM